MNEKERLKAQAKLIEARNRCAWVITHIRSDLPYSAYDIEELREAKKHIMYVRGELGDPYPPPEPPPPDVTVTKYRLFENAKTLAAVTPGDLGDLYWQFHDGMTKENFAQTREEMAKHHVNGSRHFFHYAGAQGDLTKNLVPFKRAGNKFNLWELDPVEWGQMKWRLEQEIIRGITPILCVAAGWKGSRYKHTAWHPSHNIGVKVWDKTIYMTSDHRRLYGDPDSGRIFRGVAEMLAEALKGKRFILEAANEPPKTTGNMKLFTFYNTLFNQLKKNKNLDGNRLAFEKWDSRWIGVKKVNPNVEPGLQDLYPGVWCFYHAQNSLEQCIRWHRGEMGKIHNAYPGLCSDSDGGSIAWPGYGLIGKRWGGGGANISLQRITPRELQQFLIYDHRHNGAGYCHLSASCFFESDLSSFESFMKAGVRGFTEAELNQWVEQVREWRNLPSFDAKWEDFSDDNDEPLSELMAVKHAMNHIHK